MEKLTTLLDQNKFASFAVEGNPKSVYEDLWTLRVSLFKDYSKRIRFNKQEYGVEVQVSGTSVEPKDIKFAPTIYEGETIHEQLNRAEIASHMIALSPPNIRFNRSALTPVDIEKLGLFARAKKYEFVVNTDTIQFTQTNPKDEHADS